ncbi:MAG: hypothetical protein M1823_005006 [Watsoniomyces obsoletus]|nr:MAG: hypothetical protein M1823_005006 [Watsoniomyces obsoletus]
MASSADARSAAVPNRNDTVTTTLLITNLHCPSCASTVETSLAALQPPPSSVASSILDHSLVVRHDAALSHERIRTALEDAGFEIYSILRHGDHGEYTDLERNDVVTHLDSSKSTSSFEQAVAEWPRKKSLDHDSNGDGWEKHVAQCHWCRADADTHHDDSAASTSADGPFVVIEEQSDPEQPWQAIMTVAGMTCSSCVAAISDAVSAYPWVRSVDVRLMTSSAYVDFDGRHHLDRITQTITDLGYDAHVQEVKQLGSRNKKTPKPRSSGWRASFAVDGMTCSSCVHHITEALKSLAGVEQIEVNLLANSASVTLQDRARVNDVQKAIADAGYDAKLSTITEVVGQPEGGTDERTIELQIKGIHCDCCPGRIERALVETFGAGVTVQALPTRQRPILKIQYTPSPPGFTVRQIIARIAAVDPAFETTIYHPPTLEERARVMLLHERWRFMRRTMVAVAVGIPTFVIGIVYMSLVPDGNRGREYLMHPMWLGSVRRADWALWFLATLVYFFAADVFHVRALKELRALWRPGSPTPILRRFYRFGSMNLLMSLGTTLAYFSSVAELVMAASQPYVEGGRDGQISYFDSVVFLTMFLLLGRLLEAYSKAKTGDAVAALGRLRPSEAILVVAVEEGGETAEGKGDHDDHTAQTQRIPADQLEVGDIVRVPQGASPPLDGIVVAGRSQFDESALTGESRPVTKHVGDDVFSGTINQAAPITVRITSTSGTSMLDQIVAAVRQGQARRAPIERVADLITGYFVPGVTLIAVLTWVIWLTLGLSGALPDRWLDVQAGGWPLWSLQFAIAVFVIACPCGIGLAAPTALFVGGGLAAQHGILALGGGEAFQEASRLDCIVLDKTGTVTQGGEPAVTDVELLASSEEETFVWGVLKALEEHSSHPVATAIVRYCSTKTIERLNLADVEEIAGRGLRGRITSPDAIINVVLGNEALLAEHEVPLPDAVAATLHTWKSSGKSVVLLGVTAPRAPYDHDSDAVVPPGSWRLSAILAVADPVRPEAAEVIRALQPDGIAIWMVSGDNVTTASAVGEMVGIAPDHIIAGVLPEQKAEQIRYLQRTAPTTRVERSRGLFRRAGPRRAVVGMVGDGINDAPALTAADVGIAIGSGSDVAISSAKFVLLHSDLQSLLTLLDLSRVVLRRVVFNFFWALIYNMVAVPVAAGVLYPIRSRGEHIRLDPVWASLAMALSSISVVCSSLLLRSRLPGVGFRTRKRLH